MRAPSAKALDRVFPGKGKALRALLKSDTLVWGHPSVVSWLRECYHRPLTREARLHALDATAETFGVESIGLARGGDGNYGPRLYYLNTGDIYNATLVRFPSGQYAIRDVAGIIESRRL